jgi:hypothetical protein
LSKIVAGKAKLELAPVELQPLLRESLKVIAEKAVASGIELLVRTEGLPASIHADGRRLRQIPFNLLSNAVKSPFRRFSLLTIPVTRSCRSASLTPGSASTRRIWSGSSNLSNKRRLEPTASMPGPGWDCP